MQLNLTATNSGGANGTIQSGIAGGTPPFNFLWSTGDTTGHLTGIPPGWYSLLVTDAEGCAVIDSAEVEGPLPCDIPANVTKQHSPHQITFSWAPQANAVTTQIQVKVKPGQASIAPDFRTAFALQGQTSKTIQVQPSNCGSFYMSRLRHICDSFSVAISDWKTIQVIPTSCLKQPGHIKATLFPNPANDVLNISWPSLKVETVTFTVLDIAGKKIISKKEKVVDGSNLINFSTSGLAEGIYLLKGNNKMIGRFAVVHN